MGGSASTLKEITVSFENIHVIDNEKIIYKTDDECYPLAILYFEEAVNKTDIEEDVSEGVRARTVQLNLLKKWASEPLKFTGKMMGIDRNIKIHYEGFVIKYIEWDFDPLGPLANPYNE